MTRWPESCSVLRELHQRLLRLYLSLPEGQQQFLKFGFVGGIGFVVDAGSLTLLTRYGGLDPITARVISMFALGMTTTWLLNRSLTFRGHTHGSIFAEYLRFAAANAIGNSLNFGIHAGLVETVPLVRAYPVLGAVAGTAVGLVFNFTSSKYFVFRKRKADLDWLDEHGVETKMPFIDAGKLVSDMRDEGEQR
jgi:dolichol-phosphate mannosyltransferase